MEKREVFARFLHLNNILVLPSTFITLLIFFLEDTYLIPNSIPISRMWLLSYIHYPKPIPNEVKCKYTCIGLSVGLRCIPFVFLPVATKRWFFGPPSSYLNGFHTDSRLLFSFLSWEVFGEWETRGNGNGIIARFCFAIKPVFGFLIVRKMFDSVYCLYAFESTFVLGFVLTLVFALEGFLVAQYVKHLRSHYPFFVCAMAFSVCLTFDAFGASDVCTWIVVALCLAVLFINHFLVVLDDEALLINVYTSSPRHRVNNYPRFLGQ